MLLAHLQRRFNAVYPVYLRAGLVWEPVELFWLKRWLSAVSTSHLEPLEVVCLSVGPLFGAHWSLTGRGMPSASSSPRAVYLPGRNLLLLSCAAIFSARRGIRTIALGTLAGNPFADATPVFFRQLAACLSRALSQPMGILTPFRRFTKARLIAGARTLPLGMTFSCLSPRGRRHCGRCNKCAERQLAFRHAHIPDPTRYAS